jgi:hypothetical protein
MNPIPFLKRALLAGLAGMMLGGTPADAGQGAASFVTVTGNITSNTRWTRDKVYILTRMIFIHNNATLTIEPGTIIRGIKKGAAGSDLANEPGTLVVARSGRLIANGTAEHPIIFTSIDDSNVPGGIDTVPLAFKNSKGVTKSVASPRNYAPDGPVQNNGFAHCETWGGLVVLGRSYLGAGATGSTDANADGISDTHTLADDGLVTDAANFIGADVIEGINATLVPRASGPNTPKLGVYGGTNDNDNSGVFRFLSIRYAGDVIGTSNELNGITLGAPGSNTVMEHCEVAFNTDDGFEWFGGKVDARFLFSMYNRDDAFDADEGVRLRGQFFTAFQGDDTAVRGGYTGAGNAAQTGHSLNSTGGNFYNQLMEIDGSEPNGQGNLPQTRFDVYNFTFISAGTNGGGSEHAVRYRLGAIGSINNGYAGMFPGNAAIGLSDTATGSGDFNVASRNVHTHVFTQTQGTGNDQFNTVANAAVEAGSQLNSILPYTKNGVDLRVAAASGVRTEDGAAPPSGFADARFAAAALDSTHLNGWSVLDALNVLPANHPTRIEPVLGINGTDNPTVSFQFAGRGGSTVDYPAGTKFLVERSANQRTWTPVVVVSDGEGGKDLDGAAGSITVQDTAVLGTGVIFYRVIAL